MKWHLYRHGILIDNNKKPSRQNHQNKECGIKWETIERGRVNWPVCRGWPRQGQRQRRWAPRSTGCPKAPAKSDGILRSCLVDSQRKPFVEHQSGETGLQSLVSSRALSPLYLYHTLYEQPAHYHFQNSFKSAPPLLQVAVNFCRSFNIAWLVHVVEPSRLLQLNPWADEKDDNTKLSSENVDSKLESLGTVIAEGKSGLITCSTSTLVSSALFSSLTCTRAFTVPRKYRNHRLTSRRRFTTVS